MGNFPAVKVLLGTSIYFFIFYLISWSIISDDVIESSTVQFNNPGFQTGQDSSFDVNQNQTNYNSLLTTFSFMSGIGTNNVDMGEPPEYSWIFNFIFFWIPLSLFMLGLYFALPFLH